MRALTTTVLLLAGPVLATAGEHVRLGEGVVPLRQEVHLKLDPKSDSYSGSVRVELDVRTPGAVLRLHAEELTVTRAAVDGVAAKSAAGADSTLVITPARPLAVGKAVLTIEFSNEYDRRQVGLYKMARGDDGYVYTQFEPIDARKAYPCFDEPGFKIPWQVTVEIPVGYDAVSNTPETAGPEKGGFKEVRFAQTKPLPSYLVALAVGKFGFVPIEGMGVPGRVVTMRGQEHLAGWAARMTPPLLKAAEEYFGTPYPYEKLDLIAVSEYWPGAMEHPGAVTFADAILLLDEKTATPSQKSLLARVDAHELAHMWFGDLVTMAWWDDLWLNESFADWLGDKLADQVYPELQVGLSELQTVQNTFDLLPLDPPQRSARRQWLKRPAWYSRNRHSPARPGHSRASSSSRKPARTLSTASSRVTALAPSAPTRWLPTSASGARAARRRRARRRGAAQRGEQPVERDAVEVVQEQVGDDHVPARRASRCGVGRPTSSTSTTRGVARASRAPHRPRSSPASTSGCRSSSVSSTAGQRRARARGRRRASAGRRRSRSRGCAAAAAAPRAHAPSAARASRPARGSSDARARP